jgi:hypothetical protein
MEEVVRPYSKSRVKVHRLLLLALALTSSACSSKPTMDYDVTVDPAFSPAETDAVIAGVEDWGRSIPELQLTYKIASCDSPSSCQVCFHPQHDAPDPTHDVVGSTFPGSVDDSTVWIYVDRIQATGWDVSSLIEQTTAHEMGHAVGLHHTGPGTLMAADVPDQAHGVTSADVSQFWSVRGQ